MKLFSNHTCFIKATGLTLVAMVLLCQVQIFGAKGGAKDRKGVVLKFKGFEMKNVQSSFNLRNGIQYKGSFNNVSAGQQQTTTLSSILTYQKSNVTFIYPYKHKVSVPKFKTPEAPKY